jgi:hypothetical protein
MFWFAPEKGLSIGAGFLNCIKDVKAVSWPLIGGWRSLTFSAPFEISNHPAGGVVSRGTGDTAAGMGTGTAEVKVFNGGSILRRPGMRPQAENLVQVVAPVEYIRFSEPVDRFQIEWAKHLAADNEIRQIGH